MITEGVEIFDGVSLDDRMNCSSGSLQVRENIIGEEFNDVHQSVGRGNSLLQTIIEVSERSTESTVELTNLECRSSRGDRRE